MVIVVAQLFVKGKLGILFVNGKLGKSFCKGGNKSYILCKGDEQVFVK